MRQLLFHFAIWVFSGCLYAHSNTEVSLQQTFSKPHMQERVTQTQTIRLKEIDITNPIFIFK